LKKIVAICSNKTITYGHKLRLEFLKYISQFIDIDIYGKGLNPDNYNGNYKGIIPNKCKFDILSQYQYTIVFENSEHDNYMTEKIYDCFLSLCMPIYWGCSNLNKWYPVNSFYQLNIKSNNDFERELKRICNIISMIPSETNQKALIKAKELTLNRYNIWPSIENIIYQTNNQLWKSQFGQDIFCFNKYFHDRMTGTFVDIGASDGFTFSNTWAYEKIGWNGLCLEPRPNMFEKLKQCRSCHCEQYAILCKRYRS